MHVRVREALVIGAGEVPPRALQRLRNELSFPNPAWIERVRRGLSPGREPERICFVEEQDGTIRLPRGAIHALRRIGAEEGAPVICHDERTFVELPAPVACSVTLRPEQDAVATKLVKVTQGFVVAPCGAGKTMCGIGAIARLRASTLVLVHTADLAAQWRERIRGCLGLEAGMVGGGEEIVAPVTVALVQTLCRWDTRRLDALLERFGLLVLDEGHHVAARTFHRVVGRSPARYRLGLTATPEREDGLTPLLLLFLGAPLMVLTQKELVASGVLTLPEVRVVETEFTYPYTGAADYARMLDALTRDEARNALILETVVRELRGGRLGLVLSGRVDHCEELAARLRARRLSAEALTGQVPRAKREALLERARQGAIDALVATTLADEGLDLPRLSRVFLTCPGRSRARTAQRLGRLMRPHADKNGAVFIDFVDRRIPLLRRHHAERRRHYAEVLGRVGRVGEGIHDQS